MNAEQNILWSNAHTEADQFEYDGIETHGKPANA
jgi:hypothetical protein